MSLSERQRQTLIAIAEAALPAGTFIPGAGEKCVDKVAQLVDTLPGMVGRGLGGLLAGLDAAAWLHGRRSFARLPTAKRLEVLEGWRRGDAVRRLMLRALISPLKMAHFDDPAMYSQLGCVYEAQKIKPEAKPAYMRDRVHKAIDEDVAVDADVVVIGTGAGGAVVGKELAEAGLAVVFVEEGAYFDRSDFTGRPFEMQQKLYKRGGATFSVGNVGIPIPVGQTVGGTTTVNSGTCYRTPDRVLHEWQHQFGLAELGPEQLAPYFERVEGVLGVEPAKRSLLGGNGRVIERGCNALGFKRHGPLKRNAPACDGQGVCVFGCPTDAKRSTNVSYIPLALKAGAELFAGARVTRIIVDGGKATGVDATMSGKRLTVRARAVIVACGALGTPMLLSRQGLANRSGQLGENLSIHPASGALAEFAESISPWNGIPQGYGIEELHEEGILFEGAMVPLEMTMTMTQQIGPDLVRLAESFDKVASFGFMIEDTARGSVREIMGQPVIRYSVTDADVAHVKRAMDVLAQVFFASGATRVHTPINGFDVLRSPRDLEAFRRAKLNPWDLDLSAYHPLGTARMGVDPATSVVGADHQTHDVRSLYVVDGAAVPSSLGVNPQVTIMAMATRAAEKIAAALS
ncbi:MAG TPA: GMC family oxidoreductase [Kofleriaceae bacterium]|jgi:choline dehydrogenase-like flavoprotein